MALNTETAFAQAPPNEFRADAERLSNIVLEMQRCFVLHLCKELAPGKKISEWWSGRWRATIVAK